MVLDLVILGLAITLMPVTILAFGLILGAEKGLRVTQRNLNGIAWSDVP